MRKNGWIKLWRQFSNSPLWLSEPFTRAQAWLDLQMMACYLEDGTRHPGDVYASLRYLARRWQWSRDKVSRFLQWMADEQWITLNSEQTENQSPDRPLLRLDLYGFDQLGQPLSLPDRRPLTDSARKESQPENQPGFRPASGLESTGFAPSDQPANRPPDQPAADSDRPGFRPENRPGFRPASDVETTGFAPADQPANRPPDRPAADSDRPGFRPENRPGFRPVSDVEFTGLEPVDQPANQPPDRPKTGHKEEEYRSILCRGVKAPGIEEKEVPMAYRERFPTWEEYIAWRYQ